MSSTTSEAGGAVMGVVQLSKIIMAREANLQMGPTGPTLAGAQMRSFPSDRDAPNEAHCPNCHGLLWNACECTYCEQCERVVRVIESGRNPGMAGGVVFWADLDCGHQAMDDSDDRPEV